MKVLDSLRFAQVAAKALGKPVMYISIYSEGQALEEVVKAAPYLNFQDHGQVICDGYGFIVFKSLKEMNKAFWQTVGDDGPTKTNPYNGPVRVYALTISAQGRLLNENT